MNIFKKIEGKKVEVSYETGAHYLMTYTSEEKLLWQEIGEDGEIISSGEEPYWTTKISQGIYNINWIEADGLTVSQILDFNTSRVYAFLTWEDFNKRGKRDQVLQEGVFKLV